MRHLSRFILAAALAGLCGPAAAQFGFSLPGLGGGKGSGPDLGSMLGNAGKAFKETTEEEEILIGHEFSAILLGAKPLYQDAAVQRYVNTLGRWLASQTERPDLPWAFGVLDDPDFNAFATPGGYIFVTKGLLDRMRSEAELAGVLAHEIGHVVKKHHLNAMKKKGLANLGADLISIKTGNDAVKNAVLNIGRELVTSGLDKSDEFEADRVGVVIAARAGYDAFGLPSVLQMLQGQSASDGNFSFLFGTHPSPDARIELLGSAMKNQFDGAPGVSGRPPSERYKEFGK